MIRIRVDDVMCDSSSWPHERAVRRITAFQRWVEESDKILYTPTILVSEIRDYPEIIDLLKEKVKEGKVSPELHGYQHIDYASLSKSELDVHLDSSVHWFIKTFEIRPTIWATPWGGKNELMEDVSKEYGLKLETTHETIDVKRALDFLRAGGSIDGLENSIVLEHWWNRGSALRRLIDCIKYGSYEEAVYWDKKTRENPIF